MWNIINRSIRRCETLYSDPKEIIECLEKLIQKYGNDGMILLRIGEQYERIGEYKTAAEYYLAASKRFPLKRYKNIAIERYNMVKIKINKTPNKDIQDYNSDYNIISSIKDLYIDKYTLFVVNCTKTKAWDLCPNLPDKLPARLAYQGKSFHEFLALINYLFKKFNKPINWVILSARYGFLKPCDLIGNYDVMFGEPGSISDDELRRQAEQYSLHGIRLADFVYVYVYTSNITYYEKACQAFNDAITCKRLTDKLLGHLVLKNSTRQMEA